MIYFYRTVLVTSIVVVTYVSMQPTSGENIILHLDKLLHFLTFFYLSWLSDKSLKKYSHVTIFFLLIFYGLSLEILQSFTLTRSPELFDFFSDLFGILVYFYLIPKLKLISK